MFKEIGISDNLFNNEEYELFENIKNEYFKVIDSELFSQSINLDEFIENEGWSPSEIYLQDPDVVFYSGEINNKKVMGIKHSGIDQVFTENGCNINKNDLINSKTPNFKDEKEELSWLLAPQNSVLSIINTGTEKIYFKDDVFLIFESNIGFRYQLLDKDKPIASLQVVNDTINNIYTSKNHRKKGLTSKLINRALKDFPELKHSNIQTELGKKYSRNSKLKKNKI